MAWQTGTGLHQETVDQDSLPGYGPVIFVNCPVRTRMQGGVGRGRKTPFTRLGIYYIYYIYCFSSRHRPYKKGCSVPAPEAYSVRPVFSGFFVFFHGKKTVVLLDQIGKLSWLKNTEEPCHIETYEEYKELYSYPGIKKRSSTKTKQKAPACVQEFYELNNRVTLPFFEEVVQPFLELLQSRGHFNLL
ncbi:MAG: hypothetical protein GWP10_19420 [Nitrospiraceae bacterium]|nr:hypothetical protein [Nitrospiraceae bacterium]